MTKSSSKKSSQDNQQAQNLLDKCKICGAPAMHSYFGVISCEPCKMFFKRNAEQKQEGLKCKSDGHCEINTNNRHICSYCRLRSCFKSGMQVEKIRSARGKTNKQYRKRRLVIDQEQNTLKGLVKLVEPEQFPILNVLKSNHSTLTIDQCNLISNLSHCFDEYTGLEIGERYIREQTALPLKLRFKPTSFIQYLQTSLEGIQLVYKNNKDFHSLCAHDRPILLHSTSKHIGILITNFIHHHIGLINYETFYNTMELISHPNMIPATKHIQDLLHFDIVTMKLMLTIISFSTTNLTFYSHTSPVNLLNSKEVLRIQNTYVELLWGYLMYKHNFNDAVVCFSDLMQCLSAVHEAVVIVKDLRWFTGTINSIVQQIK